MTLHEARLDLCLMLNHCTGCTRYKDSPPPKQSTNTVRKAQNMCQGCGHYEVIQAQVAAIETMQKERRKQRLRRMAK